ncbi:MAG TPA: hypothetical protein VE870_16835 [Bacteroidales bacterium]|nr:hypothetical protein [Bacteroidales bacterium]
MRNIPAKLPIISILFFVSIPACQSHGSKTEKITAVEQTITCRSNPGHTYEVFIPAHKKPDHKLPLLIAIDPHGSGKTAVEHLKEAASEYRAILVASNLVQNNDRNFVKELDELMADVKSRYPVGEETYFAGFSGGARMALEYAIHHQANGVVASGAFARPDQLNAIKCPVFGIIGMDDFNFLETAQYVLNPPTLPKNAHIELTRATHEWPDENMLTSVFGWFRLQDEAGGRSEKQKVINYVEHQKTRVDSLTKDGELLQAACIVRNMAAVSAFDKNGSFNSAYDKLKNSNAYKQQLSGLTESLQFEVKMRKIYGQALMEKDRAWWEKEISALHTKMVSEPDETMRMAYKRLSGFIGIACYSYARQFATQKDVPHLEQILMVYRLAEPDNPDLKHFEEMLDELRN